ncbi:GNAT family N-acetyltransferase, partial [Streptomyces xiamenensis]
MKIVNATPEDLPLLLELRKQASAWLRETQGIDQWANPFPAEHILDSINAGSVYLIRDGSETAGTVTLDRDPEPDLWLSAELEGQPSLHMHKL